MQKVFSYPVKIMDLNQQEQHFKLSANDEQLQQLTQIFKVESVQAFSADIFLKLRLKQHRLDIWGCARAQMELESVISLEKFVKTYEAPFEYWFDTKATYKDIRDMEAGIDDDVPDVIEDGQIDLVSVAVEQIALVMEDYPRKDGEIFRFQSQFDDSNEAAQNPFAVLEKLKK